MTTRLPHENDEWPIYRDARNVPIMIGDDVVYGTRKSDQAEAVVGRVVGFSDKGQVIIDVLHRVISDRHIWPNAKWRGSLIDPDRVFVIIGLAPSDHPTREQLIQQRAERDAAAKQNTE